MREYNIFYCLEMSLAYLHHAPVRSHIHGVEARAGRGNDGRCCQLTDGELQHSRCVRTGSNLSLKAVNMVVLGVEQGSKMCVHSLHTKLHCHKLGYKAAVEWTTVCLFEMRDGDYS